MKISISIKTFLGLFHRTLARFPLAVWIAVKIPNQAAAIVSQSLSEDTCPGKNSEGWLITQIAPLSKTFVDVGANVGNWSALFLKSAPSSVKGILFEPSSHTLKVLRTNLEHLNNLEIVEQALGDSEGIVTFFDELGMGESSSVIKKASLANAVKTVVSATTLDSALKCRSWDSVDFLKIDAEGYDFQVIKGAHELLRQKKIGVLQFEYGPGWKHCGATLSAAVDFLESFGYRVFLLNKKALLRYNPDFYGEYFAYSNYVAISPAMYEKMALWGSG